MLYCSHYSMLSTILFSIVEPELSCILLTTLRNVGSLYIRHFLMLFSSTLNRLFIFWCVLHGDVCLFEMCLATENLWPL